MAACKKTILYFGNDWDAENRTSSHHIARLLSIYYDIYYIECPGLRAPQVGGRDLRKIFQKVWRSLRGSRAVMPSVKVNTILQIPYHRFPIVRWLNAKIIRWTMYWMMWRNKIRSPISWFVAPHLGGLAGHLGEVLSVYYCVDDYAAMPNVDKDSTRSMDELLTRNADLVFVASDTLLEQKRAINPNTVFSPHGVDVKHFSPTKTGNDEVPHDIRHLPRPVIGFFGLIEQWIDLELIAFIAAQRPEWTLLMIGRVAVPSPPVLPNLHFIGRRPYEQLPDYARRFDVAIIPYKLNQQVLHANPLKLREYLAIGMPIVSVSTPETDKYADVVEIAHGHKEFLMKLDHAVTQVSDESAAARRRTRVALESWDNRLGSLLGHVQRTLDIKNSVADR